MEIVSLLGTDDLDTFPRPKVSFPPKNSPIAYPEPPLSSSGSNSEDEDMDGDGVTIGELQFEAEDENNAPSSDSGDSTNLSLPPSSPPKSSSCSSATSDAFNPNACNSRECGIRPYTYEGSLPDLPCQPYPWVESTPPPRVFMAQ